MSDIQTHNPHMVEDLTRLRDELSTVAFDTNGRTLDHHLAVVVFKINSCLYKGYPRRPVVDTTQVLT